MGEYLLPSSFTFRATSIPSPQRFSCFHFFLLDRDHSLAAETFFYPALVFAAHFDPSIFRTLTSSGLSSSPPLAYPA